jgi:predicted permease
VLSLALGIGATAAIYSLVDQILLHALPVRQADRLVLIDWKGDQVANNGFGSYNLMSYPLCRELQKQDRLFEGVLCRAATAVNLSTGTEHRPAPIEIVSGSYFTVLGVGPAMGRVLTEADDGAPNANPVAVLSYDFWQTHLAGAADIIGRNVYINRNPFTVVGVASRGFRGVDVGEVPVLWVPASMSAQAIPGFNDLLGLTRWMQILARLAPGVSAIQAQAGIQPRFKAMLQENMRRADFPNITEQRRKRYLSSYLEVSPSPRGHSKLHRFLSQPLWVLLAATAVLLGLACLNVAGLFLARGSAREREIRTRLAIGASRGRIGRQLLADSFLLALTGGLLGVALAPLAMRALIAFLPNDIAANAVTATVDARLLLVALGLSLTAGVLSGLAPALQAGRGSLAASLRGSSTSFGGVRLRKTIVTLQIAFTLVLVVGAALFVRTLTELMAKGPGFSTSGLISFGIDPVRHGYSPAETGALIRRIYQEIEALQSTQDIAISRLQLLTGGSWNNPMTIQTDRRSITDREVHLNSVTPGFFATLGARIVAGRDFDVRDTVPVGKGGARVAIVNEAFAKRYLDGRNPVGARICIGSGPDAKPDIEITGVMANISYRGVREEWEQVYFPMVTRAKDSFYEGGNFYVRVQGSPAAASQAIRTILRKADPALPLSYFRTVDDQVRRSLNTERMLATISSSFGILALVLSLVGLYGVMSFVVTRRTREIGIRLALGCTRLATVWLVLRDALAMVGVGIAIALPCVWILGRLIQSQLYDVTPTDPATIAAAALILCASALAAAFVPARRASAVNPTDALRSE